MPGDKRFIQRLNGALPGRYRIEKEVGSGGMATVFLAHDLKHDRRVALKVLKSELAAVVGTERFLAEIRTTASLAHPHILPLFDSGEADGFLFFVMPFVEGESLEQRLGRSGQLPVEDAVRIASRVADALESAHRQGVIHRDIKPANVLLLDGEPLLADFGIALALKAAGVGRLTETGLSLGTPHYMSPEQAMGEENPGASSDVYALGCVLYEMLTGDPPHTGSSVQGILGKILTGDVTPPSRPRPSTPPNVEAAIFKALEKAPADRFQSAAGFAEALNDETFRHGPAAGLQASSGPWRPLAIALAVTVGTLFMALATGLLRPEPRPAALWHVLDLEGLHEEALSGGYWPQGVAISPFNSRIAYPRMVDSTGVLWVTDQGSAIGDSLPGTQGASNTVFSPDGEWVAYSKPRFGALEVLRQPIDGGSAVPVRGCSPPGGGWEGIIWMTNGSILCKAAGPVLVRAAMEEGEAIDTVFVAPDRSSIIRVQEVFGRNALLVTVCPGRQCPPSPALYVVDLENGSFDHLEELDEGVMAAWYTPTGHLVWVRPDGSVLAADFDLSDLTLSGPPTPIFEGVQTNIWDAGMEMALDGTVLYAEAEAFPFGAPRAIVWVDRFGALEPVTQDWTTLWTSGLALSPDAENLAVSIATESNRQIWIKDLAYGRPRRLTNHLQGGIVPTWAPGGAAVVYETVKGDRHLRVVSADGSSSGASEAFLDLDCPVTGAEFTPNGKGLLFECAGNIGFKDLIADTVNVRLVGTDGASERSPRISPDGNWLAYVSDASGRDEVVVVPFPEVEAGFEQVSRDGGTGPQWAPMGQRELFFFEGNWLWAATYSANALFTVENWERLFPAEAFWRPGSNRNYDLAPTGDRFLMIHRRPEAVGFAEQKTPRLILIQNFFTELEDRMGGSN